jgi:hypothetical protein
MRHRNGYLNREKWLVCLTQTPRISPSAEIVVPAGMSQAEFRAMGTTVNLLLPKAQKTKGAMAVKDLFAEWEGADRNAYDRFRSG